jgi:hypothetical protein
MYLTGPNFIRIMGSQLANRVESVKLPDHQYIQSGKETQMILHRLHFPRSAGEEVTLEGQGQPKLRAFAGQCKKRKLSKKVSDESKIRWMISALKPGNDGIAPVLL